MPNITFILKKAFTSIRILLWTIIAHFTYLQDASGWAGQARLDYLPGEAGDWCGVPSFDILIFQASQCWALKQIGIGYFPFKVFET